MRRFCITVALLAACDSPAAPAFPAGAVPWSPPARLRLWWQLTESCSGLTGDLSRVSWYVVPDVYQIQVDGKRYHGYWYSNPSRIVLAGGHRLDGPLVRHEMLHALQGAGSHPRETFLARCDGVVACDGECAVETGGHPTPQPDAPEIPPRGLATLAVVPSAPAASRDSGAVAAIVSVANPHPYAVWVRMTPQAPGDPFAHTFGIVIDYDDPARVGTWGYTFLQSTRFPLGPHETRRWVWDGELSVGRLGIRGYFNVDTAPRIVVNVGP